MKISKLPGFKAIKSNLYLIEAILWTVILVFAAVVIALGN